MLSAAADRYGRLWKVTEALLRHPLFSFLLSAFSISAFPLAAFSISAFPLLVSAATIFDNSVNDLHTRFNRDLPWSEIDMDFMNLN